MVDALTPFKQLDDKEQAALFHARDRRSTAQDHDAFDGDVASPFDMGAVAVASPSPNPYPVRKDAWVGVSFSEIITAGQLTVATNSGRTLGTPDLAADQIHRLGKFNRALLLSPTSAIAGTVTLHVFDEWFRPDAVANSVMDVPTPSGSIDTQDGLDVIDTQDGLDTIETQST